jgi:hypothetical protein
MPRLTSLVAFLLVLVFVFAPKVGATTTCEAQCVTAIGASNCTLNRTIDMLPRLADYFADIPGIMPPLYASAPSPHCCAGRSAECPPTVNVTYNCTYQEPSLLITTTPSDVYFCPTQCTPLACGGASLVEGETFLVPDRSCAAQATEFFSCRWYISLKSICEWRCRDEADWQCPECPSCTSTCS